LKPGLQKMAGEYSGKVKFVAVDVDNASDVAQAYNVKAMPTLVVVKDGEEVGRVLGANEAKIRSMIDDAL
jgi:thioredoxin-like negative regulator of GroEL